MSNLKIDITVILMDPVKSGIYHWWPGYWDNHGEFLNRVTTKHSLSGLINKFLLNTEGASGEGLFVSIYRWMLSLRNLNDLAKVKEPEIKLAFKAGMPFSKEGW